MTEDQRKIQEGKVTLNIEMQDLLNIVTKSSNTILSEHSTAYNIEGEDLKKAWFKHLLISMEKLNDLIENIRRVELNNIRTEFKEDLKRLENKFDKSVDEFQLYKKEVSERAEKANIDLELYKKEVIVPLSTKVLTLTIKLSVWVSVISFIGSGIGAFAFYLAKVYIFKTP